MNMVLVLGAIAAVVILVPGGLGKLLVHPGQPSQKQPVVAPPNTRADNANQPWSQPISAALGTVGGLGDIAQASQSTIENLSDTWQSLAGFGQGDA